MYVRANVATSRWQFSLVTLAANDYKYVANIIIVVRNWHAVAIQLHVTKSNSAFKKVSYI